jgi:glycosyltransferase involved in cell wall biosynthesis
LTFFQPRVHGIRKRLSEGNWDAVWFHGYAHYALLTGIQAAVSLGIPLFFRSESNLVCSLRGWVKDHFIYWLVRNASALLYVGTDNRKYYEYYGARKDQLFFVPYAVDNAFFGRKASDALPHVPALRAELGLLEDKPVILYAGKLMRRKNPVLLVEAYAALCRDRSQPPPYLVIVGDGEERSAVLRRAAELGCDSHLRLVGFKNQSELPTYFALCDLFVIPSSKEPFGLVVNEVMNAGKAIISTDEVGATKDLVYEGRNGFVVQAGSVEALASALRRAIADREQLRRMGQESLAIIGGWNFERCVEGVLDALAAARRRTVVMGRS